jgi:membrane protease YdiL (CAAX protease family)
VTDWATFAGLTGVALFALLALARASSGAVPEGASDPNSEAASGGDTDTDASSGRVPSGRRVTRGEDGMGADPFPPARPEPAEPGPDSDGDGARDTGEPADRHAPGAGREPPSRRRPEPHQEAEPEPEVDPITGVELSGRGRAGGLSTGVLLVNVAFSQGVFGVLVLGAAWFTQVPASALGISFEVAAALPEVALGIAIGLALYAANAGVAVVAGAAGVSFDSGLRDLLTPETPAGWALLLGVVLPVVAGVEELLFRGALIGAMSVGFDVSPWLLAVASSAAFALGHGAQGRAGIAVTGFLGFALAAAFVLSGSLLTVIVAHYVVNATEFVAGGWLGVEWN